jgi:hypothetical protein
LFSAPLFVSGNNKWQDDQTDYKGAKLETARQKLDEIADIAARHGLLVFR